MHYHDGKVSSGVGGNPTVLLSTFYSDSMRCGGEGKSIRLRLAQTTSPQPRNQPIQRWSRKTVAVPAIQVELDATGYTVCISHNNKNPHVSWNSVWIVRRGNKCNTNADLDRS